MNIDFKLKLPLKKIDDPSSTMNILVTTHLFLTPFYALESDVITPFSNVTDEHLPWIRKILFNASLSVKRLTKVLEVISTINNEDLFLLRRDFVICLVTNEMAKQFNKDLAASLSRSKTLGDFSVSTATKGDSSVIMQILNDSNACIAEMKQIINDLEQSTITPTGFVKGRYNVRTHNNDRLWWHTGLSKDLVDGYASEKYFVNGSGYKAGTFNRDKYSKYLGKSAIEYYRGDN